MYNNQGNHQQFGQRLPPPLPPFQQNPTVGPPPYAVASSGTMQSYTIPPPPPPQSSNWSQNQHISPPIRIPPPHPQGQQFYRVPPISTPSYFTPAPFGHLPPAPPPPPSSPPPGPPPLPPSSPPPTSPLHLSSPASRNLSDNNLECNVSAMSEKGKSSLKIMSDISSPPPRPRDEKIVRKIEVLCQYIAKNGPQFEEMTLQKEIDNPEFEFLFGGPPGSEGAISHEFFKWMKKKCSSSSSELPQGKRDEGISHSPDGSDMDMEDDMTQSEEPFGGVKDEAAFISNEGNITVEEDALELEHISPKVCSGSSGVIEHVPDQSQEDMQFEKSRMKAVVSDSKTEQLKINLYQETNQCEEPNKGTSPFRLIQGYASDDSEPHLENLSPEPQIKECTPDIECKDSPELYKGLGLSSVEGSLDTASKVSRRREENDDGKLKVDEFGRMVKAGGSESESDEYDRNRNRNRNRRRGGKRGRSRSPIVRRRRSPRRRRENRSRSRSWSPKKRNRSSSRSRSRSRSRSPYNRRWNRSQQVPVCLDFQRGKCFRGESCRYLHEFQKKEDSRRHKNKDKHSDRITTSTSPEKDEVETLLYQDVDINSQKVKEQESVVPTSHSTAADVATDVEPDQQSSIPDQTLNHSSNSAPAELPVQPASSAWNHPLPPPPPRPQLGGPFLQFHQNQLPPPPISYPFQAFVRPNMLYPAEEFRPNMFPVNYPIPQQPLQSFSGVPSMSRYSLLSDFPDAAQVSRIPDFGMSRISTHYNPYASTFDNPLTTNFSSGAFTGQNHAGPDDGQSAGGPTSTHNLLKSGNDQYDPLFDSIDPSSNPIKKNDLEEKNNKRKEVENNDCGETGDAEVGSVENDSPSSSPIDLADVATGEIEIDQVKSSGKTKKDSRSMKLFKVALAEFVKEVLKPSWRQGNMSKEAFKTIVKKTVDKVSGAMKKHQLPKSQAKINQYIDSSQRKLTKLVMGYVDKYVKV